MARRIPGADPGGNTIARMRPSGACTWIVWPALQPSGTVTRSSCLVGVVGVGAGVAASDAASACVSKSINF